MCRLTSSRPIHLMYVQLIDNRLRRQLLQPAGGNHLGVAVLGARRLASRVLICFSLFLEPVLQIDLYHPLFSLELVR